MKLLEYEAKTLLNGAHIPTPPSVVSKTEALAKAGAQMATNITGLIALVVGRWNMEDGGLREQDL